MVDHAKRNKLVDAIDDGTVEGVKAVLKELGSEAAAVINSPDERGYTLVTKAASEGHLKILQALVEAGGDVMARVGYSGNTPLHLAANKGSVAMVQALLNIAGEKKQALLDAKNRMGDTAAHMAASNCHVEILTILKETGANMNITNHEEKTVLAVAQETAEKYRIALVQSEEVLKTLGVTPEEPAKGDSWARTVRAAEPTSAVRGA